MKTKMTKNCQAKILKIHVTAEEIQGCRDSVLWTHRALGTGLALLAISDAELDDAMRDEVRFAIICQIWKMLIVDQRYAETQAILREQAIHRITQALVDHQHRDSERLLTSAIDFDLLPDAPGISAAHVNAVRPDQTSGHGA